MNVSTENARLLKRVAIFLCVVFIITHDIKKNTDFRFYTYTFNAPIMFRGLQIDRIWF